LKHRENYTIDNCLFICNIANQTVGAPPVYTTPLGSFYNQSVTLINSTNSPICPFSCIPGQFSPSGTLTCRPCDAGYASNDTMAQSCQKCQKGFVSQSGAVKCQFCPNGTFANVKECIDCPAGSYSTGGVNSCTLCSNQTYQSKSGQSFCEPCDTSNSEGATTCVPRNSQCDFWSTGKDCKDLSTALIGMLGGGAGVILIIIVILIITLRRNRRDSQYQLVGQDDYNS